MSKAAAPDPPPEPRLSPRAAQALARVRQSRRSGPRRRRSVDWHAVGLVVLASVLLAIGWHLALLLGGTDRSAAQANAHGIAVPAQPAVDVRADPASLAPVSASEGLAVRSSVPTQTGPASAVSRPGSDSLVELNRRLQALQGVPPPNCRPRKPAVVAAAASIHRWRDPTSGQWQFGSQPPAGVAAEPVEFRDAAQARFALQVEAEVGLDIPTQLRDRAAADVVRLTAIMSTELGLPIDPSFALALRFVDSPEAVVAGMPGMGLPRAAGLYRYADQRIVLWRQPQDSETFRTLRHEVTHALLHEFVGAPPLWLNEGLAEYFEGLQTAGSGGRVAGNAWYAELLDLAGEGRIALALETLGAGPEAFRNPRLAELYYAQSWALVDVLMASDSGQAVLAELLADLREAACRPFSSVQWLDQHYPGGTQALARAADGQRRLVHSF